jgi:GDP-D-mannose dehydratase
MKYNGGRRPCAPTGLAIKTVPHNIRKCCNSKIQLVWKAKYKMQDVVEMMIKARLNKSI